MDVVAAAQNLNAALHVLGVEEAAFAELFAAICGPTPPSFQIFGLLSAEAVQPAIARRGKDERRSLALLWRAARRRQGLPDQDIFVEPAVSTAAPQLQRLSVYKVPKSQRFKLTPGTKSAQSALLVKGASYSHGLDALRSVFSAGTNLAAPVPKSRWDHDEYYDPENLKGIATA